MEYLLVLIKTHYRAKKPNDQSVDIMLKKCSENVTPLSTPTNVTSNNAVSPTGSAASGASSARKRAPVSFDSIVSFIAILFREHLPCTLF